MTSCRKWTVLIGRHEGVNHELAGFEGARHLSREGFDIDLSAGSGAQNAVHLTLLSRR